MVEIDKEQAAIRAHLLGRLNEAERAQLEEKLVTDRDFREVALIVEGELLDEYLAGSLSASDREQFANHYLKVPAHQENLRITKALRDHALETEPAPDTGIARRLWQKLISSLFPMRWVPGIVGGALVIIALLVSWSLLSKWFWDNKRATRNAEIAFLNRQHRKGTELFIIELSEILNRAPEQGRRIIIPAGPEVVELQGHLSGQSYTSYQAVLRINDGDEIAKVDELHDEVTGSGQFVRLRVPARLLTPQDYVLTLNGSTPDGRLEGVADYYFRIAK